MRIFFQSGAARRSLSGAARTGSLVAAIMLSLVAGEASAQPGQIRCRVSENGSPARGTVVVEQAGSQVAAGSCTETLSVPAGQYDVTVRVDGVLDNPAKTVRVDVKAGKTSPVVADFETAVLEVRVIDRRGRGGIGLVTVNRRGKRIGTLGLGIPTHLSAGEYEVVVKVGRDERRYSVDLKAGQSRVIRAEL